LETLSERTHVYPGTSGTPDDILGRPHDAEGDTFEHWQETLGKMASGLKVARKALDENALGQEWLDAEAKFNESWDLIKKWYFNLWD
jgi:hypothetical protein